MKYDHMVKVNGAYYKAGEEVPEEAEENREQKATGRGKLKKE